MSQDQIIHYTSLQQFLINKGKKNNVEKVFQTLLIERAKKSKRVTFLFDMLLKCKHNLMEYIFFYSKGFCSLASSIFVMLFSNLIL
jgi:hypothetical protein